MSVGIKTVLITGANGFIGKHLQRELAGDYTLHAYTGDVLAEDWSRYFKNNCPDVLIHLAWVTGVGYITSEKNLLFLQKSIEIYRAFYQCGGKRAVFVGTEQEYSRSERSLTETDLLKPQGLYAICKESLGTVLLEESRLRGNNFTWCRLFFVYGEGEKPARLMPSLINGLLRGEAVVCSCAEFVRDYLHVSDVARALRCCLEHDGVNVVNVAGGQRTTIGEIAAEIQRQIGGLGTVRFRSREECADQFPVVWADVRRLHDFGWRPLLTLAEGLAREIDFLRAKGDAE